jgi:hypothetical protein
MPFGPRTPELARMSGVLCVRKSDQALEECEPMNGIIYLVGLVVVIMAILSLFGLR